MDARRAESRRFALLLWLAGAGCGRFGFGDDGASIDAPPVGDAADLIDAAPPIDAPPGTLACAPGTPGNVPNTGLVDVETGGLGDREAGSCGGAGYPEAVYSIPVGAGVDALRVAADLEGTEVDTTLYVRTGCADGGTEVACDTGSGVDVGAALRIDDPAPGTYYIIIDGGPTGAFGHVRASFELLRGVGRTCTAGTRNGCMPELACVTDVCTAGVCPVLDTFTGSFMTTSSTGDGAAIHAGTCGEGGDGGQRAHEVVYLLSLANPAASVAVTTALAGTDFDTLIYLRSGSCAGAEVACADDISSSDLRSTFTTGPLPAGDYYLFIDGFAWHQGTFAVEVTVTP